ncbi:MAG: hypothetical protein R2726_12700 [Acidimicrobiales bacterium]
MNGRYTPPKKGSGGDERRPRAARGVPADETAEQREERLKRERTMRRIAMGLMGLILVANVLVAALYSANAVTLVAIVLCAGVLAMLVRLEVQARREAAGPGGD